MSHQVTKRTSRLCSNRKSRAELFPTSAPHSVTTKSDGVWDFHLVKDLPLGLSPLFVWKAEQITGLTRLLTLALRLLTLLETQVRRGLEQAHAPVAGLYEGSPTRTTERPTGTRILQAFARAQITLTYVRLGRRTCWYLTPLSPLHEQLLRHLHLPTSLYTALVYNSS
jgi:hypothetical protein